MTAIAEAAQRALLRAMPSSIDSLGFAARYVSAAHEALVGGDLYEVAETDPEYASSWVTYAERVWTPSRWPRPCWRPSAAWRSPRHR